MRAEYIRSSTSALKESSVSRLHRLWQKNFYPIVLWVIVLGLLAIVVGVRAMGAIRRRRATLALGKGTDSEGDPLMGSELAARASSGDFVGSRLLSRWRIVMYRWTVPVGFSFRMTVVEVIFSTLYLSVLLTLGLVDSAGLRPRSYANRCGHLATSQIPLIIGLASKNNAISYLTGIGSEKLNVLHRAAGRSALLLALIHAYGRWELGLKGKNALDTPRIIWGITALSAFSLTTLSSLRPIRNRAYDLFVVSHVLLIFVFILAVSFHRSKSYPYVLVGWLLWLTERLVRWARVIFANRFWRNFHPYRRNPDSIATVELLSSDLMLVKLTRRLTWKAGQHAYLLMPTISSYVWETHPFTIANVPSETRGREQELVFIVKARDGFTKRLLVHATIAKAGGHATVECAIGGPYGCPPSLASFSSVVLIAGGTGVSYTLAQLVGLLHDVQHRRSNVRSILFIWITKHAEYTHWIAPHISTSLSSLPASLDVNIQIFVTRDNEPPLQSDHVKDLPSATMIPGRPDLRTMLVTEIENALGDVSVDVCGPTSLTRTVRSILAEDGVAGTAAVRRGWPNVELHVETFGW